MATTTLSALDTILCADPVYGDVHRYLINGGSWYEADQMHWRILQKIALKGLCDVTAGKSTKANQEKAAALLGQLKETTTQLFPNEDSMAVFLKAESIVKAWAPPPKAAVKAAVKTGNVFAALDDDEE